MPTTKGIMGLLKLSGGSGSLINQEIRVTSAGLKATQEVSAMDTIDGAYDYTAYRLGPVKVEGDIEFPVPAANNMVEHVIRTGAQRDVNGLLQFKNVSVNAKYDHTISYEYSGCSVNTMGIEIAAEEAMTVRMNLLGHDRKAGSAILPTYTPSPQRVITWNEIEVSTTGPTLVAAQVKSLSFEVNNNVTVFFGLNKKIFAAADNIIAGKREVTGTMEVSWNGSGLVNYAFNQNTGLPSYCTSDDTIVLTIDPQCQGGSTTACVVKFLGIIYNLEEINMTNDFFMGTQTWRAFGIHPTYKAIMIGATYI